MNRKVCVAALESLLALEDNPVQQVLIALRCLVRLKLTFMEEQNIAQPQEIRCGEMWKD